MMLGGSPIHIVWTITWTSEMSGRASRGTRCKDHMPAKTSRKVPVKTRKRLRAHQSIQRAIMLHSPFRAHRQLLAHKGLPVLLRDDSDLPGTTAFELALTFIVAGTFVAQLADSAHRGHPHGRHSRHEKRERDFSTSDRRTV